MPDTEDVVREAVLRAVGSAVERAWGTDRFALAGGLRAALAEQTGLPQGDAVRRLFQTYGTTLTGLIVRYAGPGPDAPPAPADREETRIALHDTVVALIADLVALGVVAPAGTATADDGPYASPSVHEAAHQVAHVVTASARRAPGRHPDGGDGPSEGRDRSPGAAARRRDRRAERALQEARRTLDGVDWAAVADVNRALLAALKPRERLSLLWATHPGRLVVGTANPAHAPLSALTGVPGAGVFAGSVQRGAGTGPLRRTPTAEVTGLPREAGEAVPAAFAAYGFRVTVRAPTRWDA
ncbi:hypothetical protein ACIQPQ_20460 [Streptomyces sp. NPDC091281]|uniref:hypothetical protein n=1 Tax=Streptomyces sp. NPDC091281 TaxID=3365985 RepID=UPI00382EB353